MPNEKCQNRPDTTNILTLNLVSKITRTHLPKARQELENILHLEEISLKLFTNFFIC